MASGFTDEATGLILARSSGSCEILTQDCVHLLSEIHHRRPRGMGGSRRTGTDSAANGLAVCRACHNRIESKRTWARLNGFLVIQGEDPADVPVWWRCRYHRVRTQWTKAWVRLDNSGLLIPITQPEGEPCANNPL